MRKINKINLFFLKEKKKIFNNLRNKFFCSLKFYNFYLIKK